MKDDKTIEMLQILEEDARITPAEISKMTGVPEKNVSELIGKLERKGAIIKYKTVVDWEKAGVEYIYALIDLKVNLDRDNGYDSIAERISMFPEVESVRLVSGNYDLAVIVKGKSMKDVASFIAEKISTLEQVRDTVTHFSLKMYKREGEMLHKKDADRRLAVSA